MHSNGDAWHLGHLSEGSGAHVGEEAAKHVSTWVSIAGWEAEARKAGTLKEPCLFSYPAATFVLLAELTGRQTLLLCLEKN